MKARKDVAKWCADRGISLSQSKGAFGIVHVHADIDGDGMAFNSIGTHNVSLWDDVGPVDWDGAYRELDSAGFGKCEIEDCEFCSHEIIA